MLGLDRFQIVVLSTLAIHLAIGLAMGAASDLREPPEKPAPKFRMVPLAKSPPPKLEPPKLEPPKLEVPPPLPATTPPPPTTRRTPAKQVATTPPPPRAAEPPPTVAPTNPTAGGGPVVTLPGVAPAARGIAVASGTPTDRRTGRGGSGGGSGEGVGAGSGSGVAQVVSVASIKKMAVPKGDYDYFDAKKQYPAEARQLGVGGVVRVQLTIDDKGNVVKVRLLGKGLGHGLDDLALTRARGLKFDPALATDDRPVASVLTWTFRFEVPS